MTNPRYLGSSIGPIEFEVPGIGRFTFDGRDEVILEKLKLDGLLPAYEQAMEKNSTFFAVTPILPDGVRGYAFDNKPRDGGFVMLSGPASIDSAFWIMDRLGSLIPAGQLEVRIV